VRELSPRLSREKSLIVFGADTHSLRSESAFCHGIASSRPLLFLNDAPPNVSIEQDKLTVDRTGCENAGVKNAVLQLRAEGWIIRVRQLRGHGWTAFAIIMLKPNLGDDSGLDQTFSNAAIVMHLLQGQSRPKNPSSSLELFTRRWMAFWVTT